MSETRLFDPGVRPFAGQFSALSGLSVQTQDTGRWLLGQNVRLGDQTLRSRWGMNELGTGTPTGANFPIGMASPIVNGDPILLSAWVMTADGQIAIFTQDLGTGAYNAELTSTNLSGQYGYTRLSPLQDWPIQFVVVSDKRSQQDYVVILSPREEPRVYDPVAGTLAVHQAISPPQNDSQFTVTPTFPVSFTPKDASTTTHTNVQSDDSTAQTNWTVADNSGSTTENYLTYTRNTSAESNPRARTQYSAAIDLTNSRQIGFLFDSSTPDFWERVRVDISEDGTTWTTVWDPTDSKYSISYAWLSGLRTERRGMVLFSLDHVASASRNAVNRHRLIWVAGAPSATVTCNVYAVVGTGKVPGQSYHALTYLNSASRAESLPLLPKVQPALVSSVGGATLDNLRIPFSDKIFYSYTLTYQNTSDAQRDLGVNTLVVYRNDPGDPDPSRYSYVTTVTLATWGGASWAFSSGSALSLLTTTDTTASESRNRTILAPYPGALPIPANCYCGISVNDRLVIGKSRSFSTDGLVPAQGEIWASEHENPFRFYKRPYKNQLASGGMREIAPLTPSAFASTPSGEIGVDSLYTIASEGVYRSDAYDLFSILNPRFINEHGSYYVNSLSQYRGTLYWVDKNRQVCSIGPNGFRILSQRIVDDNFTTVSFAKPEEFSGQTYDGTYRLSFTTTGTGDPSTARKRKTLIYWILESGVQDAPVWTIDAYSGTNSADWMALTDSPTNGQRLLAINSNDKKTYVLESPTQSATGDAGGTTLSVSLTTGDMHRGYKETDGFSVKSCSVLCDDMSSGTVSWTATYLPDNSTRTSGSVSLDVSSTYVLRDLPVGSAGTGDGCGLAARIAFAFTIPGGKRIYGIQGFLEPSIVRPKHVSNTS